MKILLLPAMILLLSACQPGRKIDWPDRTSSLTGSDFYKKAVAMKWAPRDSLALQELFAGNIPGFLKKFVPVNVSIRRSNGQEVKATYYVAPDYLSLGTDHDWARINITPRVAQRFADSVDCFLPTRKMVDDIHKASKVKLEPVPMYAFRDSTITMWHHHLIIEGQREGRKGLISGIKKDVVISYKVKDSTRVAIYGWHKTDGNPIQPVYTGHVYWWVDYSQGIRLVYRKVKVNGKWMDYTEVMADPELRILLCDEEQCDFLRYYY